MVRRLRQADGDPAALALHRPSGGKGRTRLNPSTEEILHAILARLRQGGMALSLSQMLGEVRRHCRHAGVAPPSASTLRRRLGDLAMAAPSGADG